MHQKKKAAIFSDNVPWVHDGHIVDKVFAEGRREKLSEMTDLYPTIISSENFDEHAEALRDIEVVFSTWDMPSYTEGQICRMPKLKALFHAAGASRHFRDPFVKNGVAVCSATPANAIPVAEFALAQILLAGAGYWRNTRECLCPETSTMANSFRGHGNRGGRVAILGDGNVSRKLQEFLAPHDLEVIAVSSWETKRTISLEEAFSTSLVVVNLFPDLDSDNAGILNADLFRRMPENTVFINVGRGRQVNEDELVEVMKKRPDLTALLDVQFPEPPGEGSELYTLPNIQLSSHIAGSKPAEFPRMADCMIEEFQRYELGKPLRHQVQPDQL